jgi:hypothetical protein
MKMHQIPSAIENTEGVNFFSLIIQMMPLQFFFPGRFYYCISKFYRKYKLNGYDFFPN